MKIELSMEQLQIIGQCLENGPYKLVAPVLEHLQRQINTYHETKSANDEQQMSARGNGENNLRS